MNSSLAVIRGMPVRVSMCSTCPFAVDAKREHALVAPMLIERTLSTASHICHQTGKDNAFHKRTGFKETLCRGARDVQLKVFANMGFIRAATDEAWNEKCAEMGLPEIETVEEPERDKR